MNRPLFCFSAYHTRDELMRILHHSESPLETRRAFGEVYIDAWQNEDAPPSALPSVYTTTIRVRNKQAYLEDLEKIRDRFPVFFVFHDTICAEELARLGPKFCLNASVSNVERVCSLALSDEQRARYTSLVSEPIQARPPIFDELYRRLEAEEEARAQDDRLLQRGIALSLQHEERRRDERTHLSEEWKSVLRPREPKKRGFPVCIVCTVSRATICLVECGCVVLCDGCVEEIWTRPTLKKVCPRCQRETTRITRVRLGDLAESDEEEEEEEEMSYSPVKKIKREIP